MFEENWGTLEASKMKGGSSICKNRRGYNLVIVSYHITFVYDVNKCSWSSLHQAFFLQNILNSQKFERF